MGCGCLNKGLMRSRKSQRAEYYTRARHVIRVGVLLRCTRINSKCFEVEHSGSSLHYGNAFGKRSAQWLQLIDAAAVGGGWMGKGLLSVMHGKPDKVDNSAFRSHDYHVLPASRADTETLPGVALVTYLEATSFIVLPSVPYCSLLLFHSAPWAKYSRIIIDI